MASSSSPLAGQANSPPTLGPLFRFFSAIYQNFYNFFLASGTVTYKYKSFLVLERVPSPGERVVVVLEVSLWDFGKAGFVLQVLKSFSEIVYRS